MIRILATTVLATAALTGLTACTNTTSGALIGGSAGAVVGKTTGVGTLEGALIGGAVGAVAGDREKRKNRR